MGEKSHTELLSDSNAVHINMLRGTIAKPSWAQIKHLYPADVTAELDSVLSELSAAVGYLRNAKIDLETGCTKATAIRTCEGGIKRFEAFLKLYMHEEDHK